MQSKKEILKVLTCPMADKPNKEYGGTEIKTGLGTDSYYDYTTRRSYEMGYKAHAKNSKKMSY